DAGLKVHSWTPFLERARKGGWTVTRRAIRATDSNKTRPAPTGDRPLQITPSLSPRDHEPRVRFPRRRSTTAAPDRPAAPGPAGISTAVSEPLYSAGVRHSTSRPHARTARRVASP